MGIYLGVDVGTSGTKTLAIDAVGNVLAQANAAYPCHHPKPLWSEQDPEDWWKATVKTIRQVVNQAKLKPGEVKGIGLSGQMHGSVFLDKNDQVVRPALLWNDQRTAAECEEIEQRAGGRKKLVKLVANPALTGFTAPKILWLRNNEPKHYDRTVRVLLPKDDIRRRLTGEFATEVSDASGMLLLDVKNRKWSKQLLSKLELDPAMFAEVHESEDVTGKLSPAVAKQLGLSTDCVVVGGAGDCAAGAIGNGIVKSGIVSTSLGTSGVVFVHSDTPEADPEGRLHTFCHAVRGKWHMMGVTLSAAGSFGWFADETYLQVSKGELSAAAVISELNEAGLRGLGGAGFPVGRKWDLVRQYNAPKLLAVNVDEGEPGTFKDRHYLESDPHRFIEGMLIASKVVGIAEVYIYVRDEYPQCREILNRELEAVANAELGDLPAIHLRRGAGAYICGEESAMIESIEGKRGMPRLRPPYVAEVGLFGRPTLEHNFESLHWVRDIVERGAQWFASQGRRGRQGLRSFSVSGRVNKPGVHLAPAGISLHELLDEYCDGMLPGHELYGYFPGGASGGILPASLADEPLDFDTLQQHGCFIGSAAVIVFSQHDSARSLALNTMRFFAHESCGQCTPCRVGTGKAVALMQGRKWNQPLLKELSQVMVDASICGLGQAAPNPLLCTFKYFPEEFG